MTEVLYLGAGIAFIVGLKQLGGPRTARSGNRVAALGMLVAIAVTLVAQDIINWGVLAAGLTVGSGLGAWFAIRVQMTSMPQLVAAFNGFGGIAPALVASVVVIEGGLADLAPETVVTLILSTVIGAVTFSGSFIAFGKLQGILPGRPLVFPGQKIVNATLAVSLIGLAIWAGVTGEVAGYWAVGGIALAIGIMAVIPIGGADMPVVIALLNSYSGLAAAATGFVINNTVLIIAGSLVGASGVILTNIMCKAMNRSLGNVLFSGFGSGVVEETSVEGEIKPISVEDAYYVLEAASNVAIVPGYGMAVAQAQHVVKELTELLEENGCEVNFGIHPVAGRMPGHMNVLLAEVDISYEKLKEMDEINSMFSQTDITLVIGANDVTNPVARDSDDPSNPIAGMPILDVDQSQTVVVIKRSLSPGFAGIANPLFAADNAVMMFSDAKVAAIELLEALKDV